MNNIFKNKNGDVRPVWQILSCFLFYIFMSTLIIMAVNTSRFIPGINMSTVNGDFNKAIDVILNGNLTSTSNGMISFLSILITTCNCLALIISVIWFWHIFHRKSISEMGMTSLKSGFPNLLKGFILGAVSFTFVFALLYFSNNISLNNPLSDPHIDSSLLVGIFLFTLVAFDEEMFARGYCISVLKNNDNKYKPLIISAIIFALMHTLNPNMSLISYLNLFLFGILTAYMFVKSGSLWLSIGYHLSWNLFQSSIFGFNVSGQTTSSLYDLTISGNPLLTGGKFGPEGGFIVTLVIIVNIIYILKIYRYNESQY